MTLKRRKREKMGVRVEQTVRSSSHMQWVRGHECAIAGKHECSGGIEAHHTRLGTPAAMSQRRGDDQTVPLCSAAHAELHARGEATFHVTYGVDLLALAAELWAKSPHRIKYESRERT